jgi:uncharacterized membrane protein YeaQ/YmgE (transglycosylase-associated protein family)
VVLEWVSLPSHDGNGGGDGGFGDLDRFGNAGHGLSGALRSDEQRARAAGHRRPRGHGPRIGPQWTQEVFMIGFIVAGLIIGALARLIKPGKQNLGILATLILGLVGSIIGGTIANLIGTGDIMELNVFGFIAAVVVSVLLLGVAEAISNRNRRAAH